VTERDMEQSYTGRSRDYPDHKDDGHRLFVAVLCLVEDLPTPVYALLDTASQWCVLPSALATELGFSLEPDLTHFPLHTRFGALSGRLEGVALRFPADEGERLRVEATCFVTADWPGPMVIGWKGCLERMRFGLDPRDDSFYFAGL
jgi:hypothetical protein